MVFEENLLLHLKYSCFVINFIILKTFIVYIISLLLGESLATFFLNQSKIKPKPIKTSSHTLSYPWHRLPGITPSFYWFIVLTVCVCVCVCVCYDWPNNYITFGFSFTTLTENQSMTMRNAFHNEILLWYVSMFCALLFYVTVVSLLFLVRLNFHFYILQLYHY